MPTSKEAITKLTELMQSEGFTPIVGSYREGFQRCDASGVVNAMVIVDYSRNFFHVQSPMDEKRLMSLVSEIVFSPTLNPQPVTAPKKANGYTYESQTGAW